MPEVLTARKVASLKPRPPTQYDVWDTKTIGLGIRVNPNGTKTWNVRFRVGRLQRRMKIGRFPNLSLADARREAKAALREVDLGQDPSRAKKERREAHTFKELAARYLDSYALGGDVGPRSQDVCNNERRLLDADGKLADIWKYTIIEGKPYKRQWGEDRRKLLVEVLPAWRNRPAREITRREVNEFLSAIALRGAPVQANRIRSLLLTVFKFAVDKEIVEHNPVSGTPMPGGSEKARQRRRVLSENEIRIFWEATGNMEPPMRAFWRLRLITAQRAVEVKDMRWGDIGRDTTATADEQALVWTIPKEVSKNGLQHDVPLSTLAQETILELEEEFFDFNEYVCAGARGNRLRIAAKKLIGLEYFRGHDLRRTATTFMGKLKVPRVVLRKILNHADPGVTLIYDQGRYESDKREALEVWGRTLAAIIERDSKRATFVLPWDRFAARQAL